jgi:hypothetical protein
MSMPLGRGDDAAASLRRFVEGLKRDGVGPGDGLVQALDDKVMLLRPKASRSKPP